MEAAQPARYVPLPVFCSHCGQKQVVHTRARTGSASFAQSGHQEIECLKCSQLFTVSVPDEIIAGPFSATNEIGFNQSVPEKPQSWDKEVGGVTFVFTKSHEGAAFVYSCKCESEHARATLDSSTGFRTDNDPSGTKIDNLDIVLPSIGTITGNGTVSAAGQLNFKIVANLAGGMGKVVGSVGTVAGGATGGLSSLAGGGHSGGSSSSGGIPFTVTGTTSNPQVLPDVGGAAGTVAKGAAGNMVGKPVSAATGGLGGLLGKKKP